MGSVAGRSDDYLTLPSGKQISPRAINLLEGVPGIAEYQIIQKSRSDFEVNIRPTSRFGPLSHEQVKQIIATGCAPESVQVNIHVVETLARAATGKLNTVVSQVDR
jgi:phenylacetate-coenzyme A ligase PaaK-like adenylate-forming protein